MIPAPKGFIFPSDIVEMLLAGYEPDTLTPPMWAKAYLSGEEDDPDVLDTLLADLVEVQIGHLCKTGLYAWRPDNSPILIYKGMMLISGSYPDCLFFSAMTNVIRANYDCSTAQDLGEVSVSYDGGKAQFVNGELSSIDIHRGKHALFRKELVLELLGELLGGGHVPNPGLGAREYAKKILGRMADSELEALGRKRAVKALERHGFTTSLSTAARALRELKAERGLS